MQLFNRWNQGQFSGGVLHPSIRSHRSGWTERTWMRAAHLKPALLQTVVLNKRKTVVCMCKNLIYVIYLIRWQLSNNTCVSCKYAFRGCWVEGSASAWKPWSCPTCPSLTASSIRSFAFGWVRVTNLPSCSWFYNINNDWITLHHMPYITLPYNQMELLEHIASKAFYNTFLLVIHR